MRVDYKNEENVQFYLTISRPLVENDKYAKENKFVLRANGDGMKNAGILNGDLLVFADVDKAPNEALVVVRLNGELTCRRYYSEGNKVRLRREDTQTPDIIKRKDKCEVLGVLTAVIRSYDF